MIEKQEKGFHTTERYDAAWKIMLNNLFQKREV